MSRGLNKWSGIGNLGKDVELRQTQGGVSVANCSVAINEIWQNKDGEKQEHTEWVNLILWKGLADIAGQYLHKGSKIYVDGKLRTRKWQDKEGKDRYTTEVQVDTLIMLDSKPSGSGPAQAPPSDSDGPLPF